MTLPFTFTVTLLTRGAPTGRDADGNDTFTPSAVTVPGCVFAPGGSVENVTAREQVTTQPTIYAPAGTTVTAYDQAVVPGFGTFDVDGLPQSWPPNPYTGWQPPNSVVIKLSEVTG